MFYATPGTIPWIIPSGCDASARRNPRREPEPTETQPVGRGLVWRFLGDAPKAFDTPSRNESNGEVIFNLCYKRLLGLDNTQNRTLTRPNSAG